MSYYPEDQDPAVSESEVNDFYNQIVEWIADNPSEVERDYSVKEVVSYLENYSECELDQLIIRKKYLDEEAQIASNYNHYKKNMGTVKQMIINCKEDIAEILERKPDFPVWCFVDDEMVDCLKDYLMVKAELKRQDQSESEQ